MVTVPWNLDSLSAFVYNLQCQGPSSDYKIYFMHLKCAIQYFYPASDSVSAPNSDKPDSILWANSYSQPLFILLGYHRHYQSVLCKDCYLVFFILNTSDVFRIKAKNTVPSINQMLQGSHINLNLDPIRLLALCNRLPPSGRASFLSSNLPTPLSLLKTCLFSWSWSNQTRFCWPTAD